MKVEWVQHDERLFPHFLEFALGRHASGSARQAHSSWSSKKKKKTDQGEVRDLIDFAATAVTTGGLPVGEGFRGFFFFLGLIIFFW